MERKVKYNYEFKLRCVQEVLKNNRSIRSVAKENNFTESNLRKWVNLYKHYGKQGLLPKMNQYYSIDFKLKVLKKIQEKSLSLIEACFVFNIPSESVITQWRTNYKKHGIAGLEAKPKGKPTMTFKRAKKKSNKPLTREEELLLEIESLRCENALLKKFNALVQAEEIKKIKRKP
nr:transposase [uncultured Flavobacterium sp.]